jgi:hypothetical protein
MRQEIDRTVKIAPVPRTPPMRAGTAHLMRFAAAKQAPATAVRLLQRAPAHRAPHRDGGGFR